METFTVILDAKGSGLDAVMSGSFNAYDDAVDIAKALVDAFLFNAYKSDMSAAQLYQLFVQQSAEPYVVPVRQDAIFSSTRYARQRARDIYVGFHDTEHSGLAN